VRSGPQFQVFYATPDNERLIPGVMWDAAGKDLTRQQIAHIPGPIPTVVVGGAEPWQSSSSTVGVAALPLVQKASFGTIGQASAPRLFMLIDPQCIYSVRALQMLQPYVASGDIDSSRMVTRVDQGKGRCCRVNLSRSEKPEAGCAITLPPPHSAIRLPLRLERSAALIARRDGVED
jgi:hypothetical protein